MKSPALPVGLAAVALFALEPFVGKVLLPRMGGTPMVWNTCVLVFQLLLLAGYWYSVQLGRMTDAPKAARLHRALVIAAAVSWPLTVRALWIAPWPGVPPALWIIAVCVLGVGLPFILLSATSPLVQLWRARDAAAASTVHRLYAVSNIASVAGLVLYVGLIEPLLGVRMQSWLIWTLALAATLSALRFAPSASEPEHPRPRAPEHESTGAPAHRSTRAPEHPWLWFVLSFSASLCLFSVNTFLATDVASFPLLFAIPLALFLLGFAVGYSAWAERAARWVQVCAMAAAGTALWYLLRVATLSTNVLDLPLPLLSLFALVLALATRLSIARPADAARLPAYYTIISAGGVAAGVLSVVVLPWAWTTITAPMHGWSLWLVNATVPEYPIALVLGMWFATGNWPMRLLAAVATVMLCTTTAPSYGMARPFEARNFYGTVRVQIDPSTSTTRLTNGTTLHGFEVTDGNGQATSYYHPASPIGQVMNARHPRRVVAMGLGVGTLAAYALRGDHYTFLEINPLVDDVASRSGYFSYLRKARAREAEIDVQIGDGRLLAARVPDGSADMLVLDAFSSDSIPVHLLTLEAFAEYTHKMSDRGVIAVHVSNRFFDLGPMVAASAEAVGWQWAIQSRSQEELDESGSTWVMLTRSPVVASSLGLTASPWERPAIPAGVRPWTDDWANLLGRLKVVATRLHTTFEGR